MEPSSGTTTGRREVTVVVVDDHPAVRAGIVQWLMAARPTISVAAVGPDVEVAWTGPGALADVVVLDLQLDGACAATADLSRLVQAGRRVVVYTMRADDSLVLQCLDLGALSYLTKAEGEEHLVEAVQAAGRGHGYTPPALAGALACDDGRRHRPSLTAREVEILVEWFQSESKELVASRLSISIRTVNSHLERIRAKYARTGRAAPTKAFLVARAIQDGLIGPDDL